MAKDGTKKPKSGAAAGNPARARKTPKNARLSNETGTKENAEKIPSKKNAPSTNASTIETNPQNTKTHISALKKGPNPSANNRTTAASHSSQKPSAKKIVSPATEKDTVGKSVPEQQPQVSKVASKPSTSSASGNKKRKQQDEEFPIRNKISKTDTNPVSDWGNLLDEDPESSTDEPLQSDEILTTAQRLSNAIKEVQDDEAFYDNKPSAEEKSEFRCVGLYVTAVADVRKAHPHLPSALPMWDHAKEKARKQLHAMQSVNIWLIDFCFASGTNLGNSFDYTTMLSIYVGKFKVRMR
jgi:hypothetical protein